MKLLVKCWLNSEINIHLLAYVPTNIQISYPAAHVSYMYHVNCSSHYIEFPYVTCGVMDADV